MTFNFELYFTFNLFFDLRFTEKLCVDEAYVWRTSYWVWYVWWVYVDLCQLVKLFFFLSIYELLMNLFQWDSHLIHTYRSAYTYYRMKWISNPILWLHTISRNKSFVDFVEPVGSFIFSDTTLSRTDYVEHMRYRSPTEVIPVRNILWWYPIIIVRVNPVNSICYVQTWKSFSLIFSLMCYYKCLEKNYPKLYFINLLLKQKWNFEHGEEN